MCGRFALNIGWKKCADHFNIDPDFDFAPGDAIYPSDDIPAVIASPDEERNTDAKPARRFVFMRWGLVPHWALEDDSAGPFINARSEGLSHKPAFRDAYGCRRCLIPATAFIEWQKRDKRKVPYAVSFSDTPIFAMAGLYERKTFGNGRHQYSCAIITLEANDRVRQIHGRMPAVVNPDGYDLWLDCSRFEPVELAKLLIPYPAGLTEVRPLAPEKLVRGYLPVSGT